MGKIPWSHGHRKGGKQCWVRWGVAVTHFCFKNVVYLFLFTLSLCCCMQAFSACGEGDGGYSLLCHPGFSLWWLLLQSALSRHAGFSSCVAGAR